ncbi:MAG TPA: type II secretion system F family protein [Bacteroidales bacterium]|nr:type II secretion system F family protein [Bacteroidales bacterium]
MNLDLITIIFLTVFLLCAIGVILIGVWFYRNSASSSRQGRITNFVDSSINDIQEIAAADSNLVSNERIGKVRRWINESLTGLSSEKLQLKLSSAYWAITDTEFILIRIVGTGLAFLLGWTIGRNILAGIFLAAIAIMVPPILLDRAISQRQQKFHNQLLDFLILIKGAVQAGYSLMQALDLAVKEISAPASEEFGRVLREVQFGIPMEGALFNLGKRMQNDDLQIVVTAIVINAQVGGNLSTVLDATISTIRDRMHLFGEIRSLTSYARYVGNFLTLMPFITGFAIFMMNPEYFDTVRTSIITQIILGMALIGVIVGNIWIRKIVEIKV